MELMAWKDVTWLLKNAFSERSELTFSCRWRSRNISQFAGTDVNDRRCHSYTILDTLFLLSKLLCFSTLSFVITFRSSFAVVYWCNLLCRKENNAAIDNGRSCNSLTTTKKKKKKKKVWEYIMHVGGEDNNHPSNNTTIILYYNNLYNNSIQFQSFNQNQAKKLHYWIFTYL